MRASEVMPKVRSYSFPLQCVLVCAGYLLRGSSIEIGAWLILASWLPGFVAFCLGLATMASVRRMKWLGLSVAAFIVWCFSVVFFAGVGL
jgi:hypothetical protein